VPKAIPVFAPWQGQQPADTYNGKQVLEFNSTKAFAELAVLWSLNAIGWDGVWIDSYRGVYRRGYWNCEPILRLPNIQQKLLERIQIAVGSRFEAWDLICWRGSEILFAECKRAKRDAIRDTQVCWLEAALNTGLSVEDFLLVEWSLTDKKMCVAADRLCTPI
jgi:hypothetical protein